MHAKTGIAHSALRPTMGIVDPHNTRDLPSMVTACSGFDVLSHAIESFTALSYHRRVADSGQVVAVERDIDRSQRDQGAFVGADGGLDACRERVAARANADDGESGEIAIALDDLVRDPRDGSADIVRREQRGRLALLPGLTGPVLKGGGARPSIGA